MGNFLSVSLKRVEQTKMSSTKKRRLPWLNVGAKTLHDLVSNYLPAEGIRFQRPRPISPRQRQVWRFSKRRMAIRQCGFQYEASRSLVAESV